MPGHHRRPLQARIGARSDTPIDLTFLTSGKSAAVRGSGGDRVKNLTPTSGPNSPGIAARARLTCRRDAHAIASPTGEVGFRCPNLELVSAVPDRVDHLAEPLATSTDSLAPAGVRSGAGWAKAIVILPPIIRASRR
jgi:hypothetical protein